MFLTFDLNAPPLPQSVIAKSHAKLLQAQRRMLQFSLASLGIVVLGTLNSAADTGGSILFLVSTITMAVALVAKVSASDLEPISSQDQLMIPTILPDTSNQVRRYVTEAQAHRQLTKGESYALTRHYVTRSLRTWAARKLMPLN